MPWNPESHIVTREQIKEARLHQLMDWMYSHEIATITAWRSILKNVNNPSKTLLDKPIDGTEEIRTYSQKENQRRNWVLSSALLYKGYGITEVKGNYMEDGGVSETEMSFVVVNRHNESDFKDIIVTLGVWFNQDTILYKPANSEAAYLIDTNGLNVGREKNIGKFMEYVPNAYAFRIKEKSSVVANDISNNQIRRFERVPIEERDAEKIKEEIIWPIFCDDWLARHSVFGCWSIDLSVHSYVRNEALPEIIPPTKKYESSERPRYEVRKLIIDSAGEEVLSTLRSFENYMNAMAFFDACRPSKSEPILYPMQHEIGSYKYILVQIFPDGHERNQWITARYSGG